MPFHFWHFRLSHIVGDRLFLSWVKDQEGVAATELAVDILRCKITHTLSSK